MSETNQESTGTKEKTEVDLAIACNYAQSYHWWSNVFGNILAEVQNGNIAIGNIYTSGSALRDAAKNNILNKVGLDHKRYGDTDMNRNALVGVGANGKTNDDGFMASDADWVFWLDDDVIPPKGVISHLLSLRYEFVSGVYFLGIPPYNPLAYIRNSEGMYMPLYNYAPGSLISVDAVGMGCTLIHKGVYRKILDTHKVFQRPDGSLIAVHKESVASNPYLEDKYTNTIVENGVLKMPLKAVSEDDNRPFPFYAMEYGRTEDLYFAELCANAGVVIHVDTSVNCRHIKSRFIEYDDYNEYAQSHHGA